jgi:hypothetical protein
MRELSIIQKTSDLIKYYVPIITRFPKDHKFTLGERLINRLYDLLEGLIEVKYAKNKLEKLKLLNVKLDIIRHQTRFLLEFELINQKRYQYIIKLIDDIGTELGAWIKNAELRIKH